MPEIVPAIIAKNFAELKEKLDLVKDSTSAVQLDIMDGIFVPNKTWPFDSALGKPSDSVASGDLVQGGPSDSASFDDAQDGQSKPAELDSIETNLFIEAHLMVKNPEKILDEWLKLKNISRVIFHFEALEPGFSFYDLAEGAKKYDKQIGIALNPETPIEVLSDFIKGLDVVLLMSVDPGAAGQEFQESVIPKITALRQMSADVKIGVDGGINLQNSRRLKELGVNFLMAGSAIFGSVDPVQALNDLKNSIK